MNVIKLKIFLLNILYKFDKRLVVDINSFEGYNELPIVINMLLELTKVTK